MWRPNSSANALLETTNSREITKLLEPLIACDVLILEEFGYLPIHPHIGPTLSEIIAGRYQKGTTIIRSNKSLARWENVSGTTPCC